MNVKEFARLGGNASVKKRFGGKSKEEISQQMARVRLAQFHKLTPEEELETQQMAQEAVDNLNKNVTEGN